MLTPRGGGGGRGLYRRLRGESNSRRRLTQDSEPSTLPTELFRHHKLCAGNKLKTKKQTEIHIHRSNAGCEKSLLLP